MGELQTEFMRDAETTSSQIEIMSSRILAMSEENCFLKDKLRDDHDHCSDDSHRLAEGGDGGLLLADTGTGRIVGVRDFSGYNADVERIRAGRKGSPGSKVVVIDTSYMSNITSSSSSPKKLKPGSFSPDRQTAGTLRKWSDEGGEDVAVEESVYDNVNRASLIIEAMRAASTDISASEQGHGDAPLSSSVTIDRRSLVRAVSALSDKMYAIQLQVSTTEQNR